MTATCTILAAVSGSRRKSRARPHPRSHHTASLVEFDEEEDGDAEKKIFIIGGYGGHGSTRDFSMDVHALDIDNWVWSKIDRIKGTAPRPRADHTVAVADNLLILCGGRGSSVQDKKGTFSGYFDDVHILDLADQEWKRPPGVSAGARLPTGPLCQTLCGIIPQSPSSRCPPTACSFSAARRLSSRTPTRCRFSTRAV